MLRQDKGFIEIKFRYLQIVCCQLNQRRLKLLVCFKAESQFKGSIYYIQQPILYFWNSYNYIWSASQKPVQW